METNVKKTPSALKWLAERRARLSSNLNQVDRVLSHLQGQRSRLEDDLAALDRSMRLYDERIDPTSIEPVAAHLQGYGKRGALKEAILEAFELHSPDWLSTPDLALLIIAKFNLDFPTPIERKQWYRASLRSALKKLAEEEVIERDHYQADPTGEVVCWRLKRHSDGLDALEQSAISAAAARSAL